jgi:hypothetical protein
VLGRVAVELASAAGARVAFAATHSKSPRRPSANERAHHDAANRGDKGHEALKAVEAPLRKLGALVEAMGANAAAIAGRAQLATSWLRGLYAGPRSTVTPGATGADEIVLVDPRRGREVTRAEIDAEVARLTDHIAQLEAVQADGGRR